MSEPVRISRYARFAMVSRDSEEPIVALMVGCEGGSLTLVARFHPESGREYSVTRNQALFFDLLDEEEHPGEPISSTRWETGWEAALRMLDRDPWYRLVPLQVDERFRDRVIEAVSERLAEEVNAEERGRLLRRWREAETTASEFGDSS